MEEQTEWLQQLYVQAWLKQVAQKNSCAFSWSGNPFQGIFDEECFKRAEAENASRIAQFEELLCQDSPASNPEHIRAYMNYYYRGVPLPTPQNDQIEMPQEDAWAEFLRSLQLSISGQLADAEFVKSRLIQSQTGSKLFQVVLLEYATKQYSQVAEQRKHYSQLLFKVIEETVLEGRWQGSISYQWLYNFLSLNKDCGSRYWGELEERLHPAGSSIDPWFWEMVQARADIFWAWQSRGSGWAYQVSEEGWEGFQQHLDSAERHLRRALEIHPDFPNPHIQLIKVAMGQGDTAQVVQELKAVLSVAPTNAAALRAGLWAMLPRWGGSHELIKMLAMEMMDCPRRDSRVPAVGYQCLALIADDAPDYGWQRIYLDPELQPRIARIFEEQLPRLSKWHQAYFRLWHELAELRYDDAKKTLEEELGGEDTLRQYVDWSHGVNFHFPLRTPNYGDFGLCIRAFTGAYADILRNAEMELLNGNRAVLDDIHKLLEERKLPPGEQAFVLEWYARWKLAEDGEPRHFQILNQKERSAFLVAITHDDTEVVREMLKLDFDYASCEAYPGETACNLAGSSTRTELLQYLREAGDPLTRRNPEDGNEPIHCAAWNGNTTMLRELVAMGIPIEKLSKDGHTPLQLAAASHNTEGIQTLLELGANPNAQDGDGDHCLIYLPQTKAPKSAYRALLAHPEIQVNLANHAGDTALHYMARWNTPTDIVQLMLDHGANLNLPNRAQQSPLDVAEASRNIRLAEFLRSKGARPGTELPPLPQPTVQDSPAPKVPFDWQGFWNAYATFFALGALSIIVFVVAIVWIKKGK